MSGHLALGTVIWSCVKPIIKIYLIMATGFFLAKRNILSVETTRNLSDMILTVFLPCLTFNKVVTNIEGSDIKNVGIICLTSVFIFLFGGLLTLIIPFISPVPKRWRGGLLAAGIFPNISDIPIAYIQTLDTGLVFTEAQGEKGVSHVVIFLTMFTLVLFNLGGFRLIERDFLLQKNEINDVEAQGDTEKEFDFGDISDDTTNSNLNDVIVGDTAEDPSSLNTAARVTTHQSIVQQNAGSRSSLSSGDEDTTPDEHPVLLLQNSNRTDGSKSVNMRRRRSTGSSSLASSRLSTITTNRSRTSAISTSSSIIRNNWKASELRTLPSQNIQDVINEYSEAAERTSPNERTLTKIMTTDVGVRGEDIKNSGSGSNFIKKYHLGLIVFFFKNCLRPCSMSTIIALIITFIPWTRALFVNTDTHVNGAPDGLPALNFIMDYTSYVGAGSVPLALILLGGSIARIQVTTLPKGFWKSAVLMVILRFVILPILGVLWDKALVKMGWVDKDDIMMRFVCIISFGLPTMTSIIYFTASYTMTDSTDRLQMNCCSLLLLLQYPVLVISLPFLASYSIKVSLGL